MMFRLGPKSGMALQTRSAEEESTVSVEQEDASATSEVGIEKLSGVADMQSGRLNINAIIHLHSLPADSLHLLLATER